MHNAKEETETVLVMIYTISASPLRKRGAMNIQRIVMI